MAYTQTERVYLKALESNQFSAAIGSLNLMHRITIEAAEKKLTNPTTATVSFSISHRSWTQLSLILLNTEIFLLFSYILVSMHIQALICFKQVYYWLILAYFPLENCHMGVDDYGNSRRNYERNQKKRIRSRACLYLHKRAIRQ